MTYSREAKVSRGMQDVLNAPLLFRIPKRAPWKLFHEIPSMLWKAIKRRTNVVRELATSEHRQRRAMHCAEYHGSPTLRTPIAGLPVGHDKVTRTITYILHGPTVLHVYRLLFSKAIQNLDYTYWTEGQFVNKLKLTGSSPSWSWTVNQKGQ